MYPIPTMNFGNGVISGSALLSAGPITQAAIQDIIWPLEAEFRHIRCYNWAHGKLQLLGCDYKLYTMAIVP